MYVSVGVEVGTFVCASVGVRVCMRMCTYVNDASIYHPQVFPFNYARLPSPHTVVFREIQPCTSKMQRSVLKVGSKMENC